VGTGTVLSVDFEVRGTFDQVQSDPDASQRVGWEQFRSKLDGPWRGGLIRVRRSVSSSVARSFSPPQPGVSQIVRGDLCILVINEL
jgi:hypothetical protein